MCVNKPILDLPFPKDTNMFDFIDEDIICLCEYFGDRLVYEPVYYNKKIPGADSPLMYARERVVRMLESALSKLPDGYTFKIFDAWRPVKVQQAIYDKYFNEIASCFPDLSHDALCEIVGKFVAPPSYDLHNPSAHNTGGAIDLTLYDTEHGAELPMGTRFDDFTAIAYTNYFENTDCPERENRRILYHAMTDAGFTNLPTEWWHYDYGTKFWSFFAKKPAIYKGIEVI